MNVKFVVLICVWKIFNDSVENSATYIDFEEINIKTRRSQQKPKRRITI